MSADEVAVAFTPEGEDNVIDMHAAVVAQNVELIAQLNAVGRAPSQTLLHQTTLETLLDVVFDGEEEITQFQCMVDINLNGKLRKAIEQLGNQLVLPEGVGGA